MSKKSTAARRPQTTGKQTSVALVRAARPDNGVPAEAKPETSASTASSPAKPLLVTPAAKPRAPQVAAKPVAPKVTAPAPKAAAPMTREQANRIARARATQHARTANAISPEHYAYVLGDLKLIAGLAAFMFVTIIVLHFVLPGV